MQPMQSPMSYGDQSHGGGRPGSVTAAALIHIILGVAVTIFGILVLIGGAASTAEGVGPIGPEQAGYVIVIAIVLIAFGVLDVITGINLFPGKGWARILSIILAVVGSLVALLFLIAGITGGDTGEPVPALIVISLVFIACWIYSIVGAAMGGRWFNRA